MIRRLVPLAVVAGALLVAPSGTAHADAGPKRAARIAAGVEAVMEKERIPGAIVGVWQKGQPPFERAFGVRDKKTKAPMRTGLHMRIGSETKTFTGTAVLQLVKDGKVGLDDPISKYVDGVPNGENITVRQLGEMRSGLVSYSANEQWALKLFGDPSQQWRPRELLSYGLDQPPLFAPAPSSTTRTPTPSCSGCWSRRSAGSRCTPSSRSTS